MSTQALGMFMSCLVIGSEGKPVKRVCKSAMLGIELTLFLKLADIDALKAVVGIQDDQ